MNQLIKTPEEANAIVKRRNARITNLLRRQGKCRRQIEYMNEQREIEAAHKEVWE